MLRPSIFNNNFVDSMFDDVFSFPSKAAQAVKDMEAASVMRTDVKLVDGNYELEIDLPGYKKEEVQAELKDGYLTISAKKNQEVDEKDDNGKYVRRERYTGTCRRSFYVGDQIEIEDVKASFDNGVLKLVFPKDKQKEEAPVNTFISIA